MDEADLLKLSFCVSIIGIILLLVIDNFYALPELTIGEITLDEVGKEVVVKARVSKVSVRAENVFLEIDDGTSAITAVVFNTKEEIKRGQLLEVEGKVARYKGEPELVVTKLKMLRNDV